MRLEEAIYISNVVEKLSLPDGSSVLNLGSSTGHFREVEQPHINGEIFAPMDRRGLKIIHSDLKEQEGVDIAGDIYDPKVQEVLQGFKPQLILACNLMEHLPGDLRQRFPEIVDKILPAGGYLIITVPYSYPLHFDPIDTYYRPSPKQLSLLFPSYDLIDAKIVISSTFLPELVQFNLRRKLLMAARFLTPFYRPHKWLSLIHRFTFLFRPYKISCLALRKITI